MDEGRFYMSKYRCEFPDWENEPRPCENPNEDPPLSCDSCFFGCEVDDNDLWIGCVDCEADDAE